MGLKSKEFYEAPTMLSIDLVQEGVICASETETKGSPNYNAFNDEEQW